MVSKALSISIVVFLFLYSLLYQLWLGIIFQHQMLFSVILKLFDEHLAIIAISNWSWILLNLLLMVQIQIRWLLIQCHVRQIVQSPKCNRNLLINRTLNLSLKVLVFCYAFSCIVCCCCGLLKWEGKIRLDIRTKSMS